MVLSAVHLLPQLRNPFAQTVTVTSQPVLLKSIDAAARQSPLVPEAERNTQQMLVGMLTSLGFQHITVTFGGTPAAAS